MIKAAIANAIAKRSSVDEALKNIDNFIQRHANCCEFIAEYSVKKFDEDQISIIKQKLKEHGYAVTDKDGALIIDWSEAS